MISFLIPSGFMLYPFRLRCIKCLEILQFSFRTIDGQEFRTSGTKGGGA